jgi:hypothetical protein
LFIFFLLFYCFYIYFHVYTLFGTSSPSLPLSGPNMFYPLWFCWRENIGDNKKDITFLPVWDKDSYKRVVALLPCTCVLQPTLVHLYQTSSLLPGHLPIVASVSLRLLYWLLYSEHINHFQVLGFLPFPYSSHMCFPFSVLPTSNNIYFRFIICIWGRTNDFWPSEPG